MGELKKRLKAFVNAFRGLLNAMKKEFHLKLHFMALLIVLNLGFYFHITQTEWLAVILCSALVIGLELINSSIEALCDVIMPTQNAKIKYIKDVAAAAVLMAAIASVFVGYLIFWPHFFN